MNASKIIASFSLSLACVGVSSGAVAGEMPAAGESPMVAELSPPTYDRVNDNTAPRTDESRRTAKNAMYLELLGNGILYSVNYERALLDNVTARVGFSYFSIGASGADANGQQSSAKISLITAPVMANYLVGGKNHNLELGAGALVVYASGESSGGGASASAEGVGIAGTATVGYRYQPIDGGFMFKAGFTPLITKSGFNGWGGLSLGGAF